MTLFSTCIGSTHKAWLLALEGKRDRYPYPLPGPVVVVLSQPRGDKCGDRRAERPPASPRTIIPALIFSLEWSARTPCITFRHRISMTGLRRVRQAGDRSTLCTPSRDGGSRTYLISWNIHLKQYRVSPCSDWPERLAEVAHAPAKC